MPKKKQKKPKPANRRKKTCVLYVARDSSSQSSTGTITSQSDFTSTIRFDQSVSWPIVRPEESILTFSGPAVFLPLTGGTRVGLKLKKGHTISQICQWTHSLTLTSWQIQSYTLYKCLRHEHHCHEHTHIYQNNTYTHLQN